MFVSFALNWMLSVHAIPGSQTYDLCIMTLASWFTDWANFLCVTRWLERDCFLIQVKTANSHVCYVILEGKNLLASITNNISACMNQAELLELEMPYKEKNVNL